MLVCGDVLRARYEGQASLMSMLSIVCLLLLVSSSSTFVAAATLVWTLTSRQTCSLARLSLSKFKIGST